MLLLLQSIIVFGLIGWIMNYFGKIAYKQQYPNGYGNIDLFANKKITFKNFLTKPYYFIPILTFCIFSAIRYKVGIDSLSYKYMFYEILQFGKLSYEIEPAFIAINKFTTYITNDHYLTFFIFAFLQISSIYFALRKRNYALIYIGPVIILSGTFNILMNGVRQTIAACVFIAIVPLILEMKKWIWFILAVFICSLMHKSAFIILPIGILSYFIFKRGILNIKIQLIIVAFCFLFMDKLDSNFLESFYELGREAGYEDKAIEAYSTLEATNKSFGLISWLLFLIQIFVILYSKRMQKIINDNIFNIMYNLFFIGMCFRLLLYNNFTIGRLSYYFIIFQPIIISTMLFIISKSKLYKDKYIFNIIFLLLITLFLYTQYKGYISYPNEYVLYKFDIFIN